MVFPQKIKNRTNHMIHQSHFCVFIQRKLDHCLREIPTPPRSLQHYLQYSRHGDNLSVHRWMNGQRKCGTYTMKCDSTIERRKSFHLQQHEWTSRALCSVKGVRQKDE